MTVDIIQKVKYSNEDFKKYYIDDYGKSFGKLKDLESTLKDIKDRLKDSDNINKYNMESVGVVIYENKYIDKEANEIAQNALDEFNDRIEEFIELVK